MMRFFFSASGRLAVVVVEDTHFPSSILTECFGACGCDRGSGTGVGPPKSLLPVLVEDVVEISVAIDFVL